jgi:hypothetical protein
MAARRPTLPITHPARWAWVNALGFALTLFLALWLLLALFRTLMPDRAPLAFAIPVPYVAACLLAQAVVIALGATIVFRFAWHGHDLGAPTPRFYVFAWSCAGLLFYACQVLVLVRFGAPRLPNVASWASAFYWYAAPVGLLAFALMLWVNVEVGRLGAEHEADEEA